MKPAYLVVAFVVRDRDVLDDEVPVEQVGHQVGNPKVRPSSLKVPGLAMPSMRKVA